MAEPKVGEVVETQFGTMTVPETKYPFRQLEAIASMMLAGHGPVAIAEKINKSRPTTNKMIAEARDVFGLAQARKPDFKAGDNKKAQKAARLKAEGKSDQQVYKELGVSRHKGEKLLTMAREAGTVAAVVRPEILEEQAQTHMDAIATIQALGAKLAQVEDFIIGHIDHLQKTVQYDISTIMGDEHKDGWHKRMANITKAVGELRAVQDSTTKLINTQQRILENLYEVKRVEDMLADIRGGTRDALATLYAAGKLTCSVEDAVQEVVQATRMRFAKRKGIV